MLRTMLVTPERVVDTRYGIGAPLRPLVADEVLEVKFTTVPTGASRAVLTITAPLGQYEGYITAWDCSAQRPPTSDLNMKPGFTVTNQVDVSLSTQPASLNGVCIYVQQTTELAVDLVGWQGVLSAGLTLHPISPKNDGPDIYVSGGTVSLVNLAGPLLVPDAGARAVTINLTSRGDYIDGGTGFVTLLDGSTCSPTAAGVTSNLNFAANLWVSATAVVPLSVNRAICLFASANARFRLDVIGWWDDQGSAAIGVDPPARLEDTRLLGSSFAGQPTDVLVQVTGAAGVPSSGVVAASLNVTTVDATTGGGVTAFPCDVQRIRPRSLYAMHRVPVANHLVVPLDPAGRACVTLWRPAAVVVDITSWWAA